MCRSCLCCRALCELGSVNIIKMVLNNGADGVRFERPISYTVM